jgi:hypothetical protein
MTRLGRNGRRTLTTVLLTLLMLAALGSTVSAATLIGDWKLRGSFKNAAGTSVKLEAVGTPEFHTVNVRGNVRKALLFDAGEGAKLTRVPKSARANYSLVIDFEADRVDDYARVLTWGTPILLPGLYVQQNTVYLYPFAEARPGLIEDHQWNRVLVTFDSRTDLMKIYLNGRIRAAWLDWGHRFTFREGTGYFFIDDDGTEQTAGMVANIRLYRGVVNP